MVTRFNFSNLDSWPSWAAALRQQRNTATVMALAGGPAAAAGEIAGNGRLPGLPWALDNFPHPCRYAHPCGPGRRALAAQATPARDRAPRAGRELSPGRPKSAWDGVPGALPAKVRGGPRNWVAQVECRPRRATPATARHAGGWEHTLCRECINDSVITIIHKHGVYPGHIYLVI